MIKTVAYGHLTHNLTLIIQTNYVCDIFTTFSIVKLTFALGLDNIDNETNNLNNKHFTLLGV